MGDKQECLPAFFNVRDSAIKVRVLAFEGLDLQELSDLLLDHEVVA